MITHVRRPLPNTPINHAINQNISMGMFMWMKHGLLCLKQTMKKKKYSTGNSTRQNDFQNIFIDFKKAIGTDRSIIKKLERGVGQAEGIIISIENETSIDKAVQWLNGVLNTMTNPHDGFIVIIEDIDGKYGIYTVNGKRLSVEENLFTAAQRFSPPDN